MKIKNSLTVQPLGHLSYSTGPKCLMFADESCENNEADEGLMYRERESVKTQQIILK